MKCIEESEQMGLKLPVQGRNVKTPQRYRHNNLSDCGDTLPHGVDWETSIYMYTSTGLGHTRNKTLISTTRNVNCSKTRTGILEL